MFACHPTAAHYITQPSANHEQSFRLCPRKTPPPMTSPELLQRFKRLDKSSPQFPDQLTNLLYKEGFKDQILKLRDEDVVWLVEYLDEVCLSIALHLFYAQST